MRGLLLTIPPVERDTADGFVSPAELASRVRQLAMDAYRVLKDPAATSGELVELSRKIDDLRRSCESLSSRQIDHWLQSAAEQVRCRRASRCEPEPVPS